MDSFRAFSLTTLLALCCFSQARADELAIDEIDVSDTPGFVADGTSIDLTQDQFSDLSKQLERNSFVYVRREGLDSQTATFSFRSSAAQDTSVSLDGIKLNDYLDNKTDLSYFPFEVFKNATIENGYDGYATHSLRLTTMPRRFRDVYARARVSLASFGTYKFFAEKFKQRKYYAIHSEYFGQSSRGDFPFVDAQNTNQMRKHNGSFYSGSLHNVYVRRKGYQFDAIHIHSSFFKQVAGASEFPIYYTQAAQKGFISLSTFRLKKYFILKDAHVLLLDTGVGHRFLTSHYDNPDAMYSRDRGGFRFHSLENSLQNGILLNYLYKDLSSSELSVNYDIDALSLKSDKKNLKFRHVFSAKIRQELHLFEDKLGLSAYANTIYGIGDGLTVVGGFRMTYAPWRFFKISAELTRNGRLPTYNEKWIDMEYIRGNPDIKSQSGYHFQSSLQFSSQKIQAFLQLYYDADKNLIRFVPVTANLFVARNLPPTTRRGVETSILISPIKDLELRLLYVYNHSRVKFVRPVPLPGSPAHRMSLRLLFRQPFFETSVEFEHNRDLKTDLYGNSRSVDPLFVNLSFLIRMGSHWQLFFDFKNLTDERRAANYYQMPLPGRNMMMNAQFTF